jgi:hypothetical protein
MISLHEAGISFEKMILMEIIPKLMEVYYRFASEKFGTSASNLY